MWQPLSGCRDPPGREAGVGVTGEGFLERKAPVGPREKPGLGEGRERRRSVGKQQGSEAHPVPELSEMGKRQDDVTKVKVVEVVVNAAAVALTKGDWGSDPPHVGSSYTRFQGPPRASCVLGSRVSAKNTEASR